MSAVSLRQRARASARSAAGQGAFDNALAQGIVPTLRPVRVLALATLVTTIGTGLWYSSWAIFFTRYAGLSAEQVGLGMTVAGLLGFAVSTPAGRLADRLGPRDLLIALATLQGLAMTSYVFVDRFSTFLLVATVAVVAERSYLGVRMALITRLIGHELLTKDPVEENVAAAAVATMPAVPTIPRPPTATLIGPISLAGAAGPTAGGWVDRDPVLRPELVQRARLDVIAYLRVVNHVGFAVGAGLAAVVLSLDSRPAYIGMVLLNAATFFCYALLIWLLPRVEPMRVAPEHRISVVRDTPYVVLTMLSGVLALCWGMLATGVPLWITHHTDAPHWTAALIVLVNSLAIILFQRRVSRSSDAPLNAGRTAALSAVVLAASCLVFALSYHAPAGLAVAILLLAAVVHVTGELLFAAGSWGLSISLMPDYAHGEYQGMFATGAAAAQMLAPVLMTTLVVGWGPPGWLVLAGIFLLAGLPTVPATRWAIRTRPAEIGGETCTEALA